MPGGEGIVTVVGDRDLEAESFRVLEPEAVIVNFRPDTRVGEALGPEEHRVTGRHAPNDPMHHSDARHTTGRVRGLEKRQRRSRRSCLVSEQQVVHGRLVLADGLLRQPQTE